MKRLLLPLLGVVAVAALALAPAAGAVPATSTTQSGGMHFVGTPDVTATKTSTQTFLTATGEVAGAGKTATATLSADVSIQTGCINKGSKDQQPNGLKRTTSQTTGTTTFNTRSGRGTFSVSTVPVALPGRECPPGQAAVVVGPITYTNVLLTITSDPNKTVTATFPDLDP